MKLIFVRHGDPNYELDCLTELGKKEAFLVAERLSKLGITKIYSSPLGRAKETASYTASKLGMDIEILPFLEESPLKATTNDGKEIIIRDRLPEEWENDPYAFSKDDWYKNELMVKTNIHSYYD